MIRKKVAEVKDLSGQKSKGIARIFFGRTKSWSHAENEGTLMKEERGSESESKPVIRVIVNS